MALDDDPGCIISREHADGTLPGWVYQVFLVLWGPMLVVAWLSNLAEPQTYP